MVEGKITPEYYISNILLNYYQIINDKVVNPLYSTLKFMDRTVKTTLNKEDINDIFEFNLGKEERDNRNAWHHLLSDTVFFTKSNNQDKIIWNDNFFTIKEVIDMCNIELINRNTDFVKKKYSNQKFYANFITQNK